MPSCPSSFRTAPRLAKKCRCARRALFLPPAPGTCTGMCRVSFLPPSSPLSAYLLSASSHSPVGLPVSPIRNPAASLPSPPTQCFPVLNPCAPRRCDAPYPARQRFAHHISAPVPGVEALSPVASLASRPQATPSPDSPCHPDFQRHAARRCADD